MAWLKDCEICNVGLCSAIDDLKKTGMGLREASRKLETESDGIWSANQIRRRYLYYKGGTKRTTRKPPKISDKSQLETCRISDLEEAVAKGMKFGAIYADPPWPYQNQATRSATDDNYPTMTVDDICALPIASLSLAESHLHLWTTNAFLFEAKRVLEAWGFEYKSCFIWVKTQMGIGNYWRLAHEFLLLGVRGGLRFSKRDQISWMEAKRGKHSAKPERIRAIIENVSPGPYLELFARNTTPHWSCWGNEIERTLFNSSLITEEDKNGREKDSYPSQRNLDYSKGE